MNTTQKIERLLDEAYTTDDPEEMERLARQILNYDKDNVEAIILLADVTEDSKEKIVLLQKASCLLEKDLEESPVPEGTAFLDDELGMLYAAVLQRLGFSYFSEGENEKALEIAHSIMAFDPEQQTLGRTLYYRIIVDMNEYTAILEECLKEREPFPAMLHSKAIAAFRLSGATMPAYRALWEAFAADPDVPFHILGYYEEPDEEAEEEELESYSLAMLFEDAWLTEGDAALANWVAGGTILLGLAASLFPAENSEKMLVLADALGLADAAEDIMVKLESRQDWNVLSKQEKVKEALKLLSEGKYLPLKS